MRKDIWLIGGASLVHPLAVQAPTNDVVLAFKRNDSLSSATRTTVQG